MNWGHKITIVIIAFLLIMLGMVFFAMRQTNEMIDKDYYKKEIAYQEVIDAKQNLLKISENNLVSQNMNEVEVTLPNGTFEKFQSGRIEFLRIDAADRDIVSEMKVTGYNRFSFPKDQFIKGAYNARISWTSGGTPFYKEESLFVE
jgi:hypothetical protein